MNLSILKELKVRQSFYFQYLIFKEIYLPDIHLREMDFKIKEGENCGD